MSHLDRRGDAVCLYGGCKNDAVDGINIEMCHWHLETAFAAYLLTNQDMRAKLSP